MEITKEKIEKMLLERYEEKFTITDFRRANRDTDDIWKEKFIRRIYIVETTNKKWHDMVVGILFDKETENPVKIERLEPQPL